MGGRSRGTPAREPRNASRVASLPSSADAVLASVSCPSARYWGAAGEGLLIDGSATPICVVPKLKGQPLAAAKRSVRANDCAAGKIRHTASRRVKKGT